ncbi:MAG: ketopantoate reductase family protein [Gemmatimonadota bacterium]|nr:ketopantoate reductase family protein [Gemmatimonadota bacterium]
MQARIVVIGAGGLGSYVGALLAKVGHHVTLVARGEHLAAIRRHGLHVKTVAGDFQVHPAAVGSAFELSGADLSYVTVKAYSLEDVADQVEHLARAGAVVVPLLNGVTASEQLVEHGVAHDRILDGIAYMTAFRTAPGRIERRAAHHRVVVGSSTGAGKAAIRLVADTFDGTGVEIVASEDIASDLWTKMAVVCALSVLCGLTGQSMGPVRTHRFGADLQERAIAEVTAVARARGIALPQDAEKTIGAALDAFPADFFPSVIHDLRSGRRTEMEELGGAIVRMAREAGIEAPLHEAATCAIQLAEPESVSAAT